MRSSKSPSYRDHGREPEPSGTFKVEETVADMSMTCATLAFDKPNQKVPDTTENLMLRDQEVSTYRLMPHSSFIGEGMDADMSITCATLAFDKTNMKMPEVKENLVLTEKKEPASCSTHNGNVALQQELTIANMSMTCATVGFEKSRELLLSKDKSLLPEEKPSAPILRESAAFGGEETAANMSMTCTTIAFDNSKDKVIDLKKRLPTEEKTLTSNLERSAFSKQEATAADMSMTCATLAFENHKDEMLNIY